jgi:hypothetical protein
VDGDARCAKLTDAKTVVKTAISAEARKRIMGNLVRANDWFGAFKTNANERIIDAARD